mgnify:CR=1 FL=1
MDGRMMKRYFSHYTIIYPTLFLRGHVIELDEENRLIRYYPYGNEIENTEFYSGLLVFAPLGQDWDFSMIRECWESGQIDRLASLFPANNPQMASFLTENPMSVCHLL